MSYIIHLGQTAHFVMSGYWILINSTHTVATNQAKTRSGRGPVCYVCKGNHRYTECPRLTAKAQGAQPARTLPRRNKQLESRNQVT